MPTDPSPSHLGQPGPPVAESDTGLRLCFPEVGKGKGRARSCTPMSEDEPVVGEGEIFTGSATPLPYVPAEVISFSH